VTSDTAIALSVGELVRVASGGGSTSLVIVRGLFGTSDVDHFNGEAVLAVSFSGTGRSMPRLRVIGPRTLRL
jgi:hypothetical protein